MVIYFVPIILCFVSQFFKELSNSRIWYILVGIYLCLFLCFGYMTGTDWKVYEYMYDNLDFNKLFYGYSSEPGYYLYMMIFKKCGIPFWTFFVFTKTILFIIIYKAILDCCPQGSWMALVYFIPWFGLYYFIDNPMRNCIAVALFSLSAKFILEQRFWKFLLVMLIAGSFHVTAFFIIPFYFLLTKNIRSSTWAILFVVINVVFVNRVFLIKIIMSVFSLIPYYHNKLITYFILDTVFVEGKLFSFGILWQSFLFVMMLCYRERIIDAIGEKKGLFAFNCTMVFMMLVRLATTIPMFMRVQLFFCVYVATCIGLVMLSFDYRSRWLFTVLLLMVSSYVCYDRVTSSSRYVPYSNCIEYAIKGDNPSYSKRVFYNDKNSPYASGQKE